ncbi:DNA-binding transcriptional repressor AcrR [Marinomonas gallaica]|uniref:DNA-binding transcriptional repressor AcrR n=1 Tax=Marinomonas gallaica TaxID=1806667 RepID=A0A1C3JRD3_9GAMM|nr:TetR/AcrR family transcriptional regulator [Marinomonas gallaica]SBT17763.1 DNA-binding transcriptional repressor AcrR [Marinomonas gallaica]SBT20089.1 DNA-binding transcriptional repressor AcrR [Marinomonas gallaica]
MDMKSKLEAPNKAVNTTKIAILDAALEAMLKQGYKAMSFRDLAAVVGIKSASVHYHFPTKGDLCTAVMRRYRDDYAERLVLPKKKRQAAQKALNKFIDDFKLQVIDEEYVSLCTVLAVEKSLLDEATVEAMSEFYEMKYDWLATVISYMKKEWMPTEESRQYASQILASMHGASVLVRATGQSECFEQAVAPWRNLVDRI